MSEQTRQSKKVVLLDLDGTLTKSDPGIRLCGQGVRGIGVSGPG